MSQYHADLFNKLLKGELSPEEAEILVSWLGSEKLDPQAEALIAEQFHNKMPLENADPELVAALESSLPQIFEKEKRSRIPRIGWVKYAAAIVLVAALGVFLLRSKKENPPAIALADKSRPVKNDVAPGKQGAILTLADGRTVVLDSLQNGIVATQNGSKVSLNNGQLTYDVHSAEVVNPEYNTISTPRGRQFQLTLSDGTQVWLNAGSSLRYPTVFVGTERKVELTGEAYFEVAKNAKLPFKVGVNSETEIEVLGTHFNVNAYLNEETINTTLLEGSVKVYHNKDNSVIKPGQQIQVAQPDNHEMKTRLLNNVNLAKVIAWKNGVFDFDNATLSEIMNQLERWYDIDVVYEKGIPKLEFYGRMGRDLTLSNVLRGLQISKVNFKLEGKKLVVLP